MGLKLFHDDDDGSKLPAAQLEKISRILTVLSGEATLSDVASLPGLGFHPLKGDRKGEYAVKVTGNYRITFGFTDGEFTDLDYLDYH